MKLNSKRLIAIALLSAFALPALVAQDTTPEPRNIGADAAQQRLKEIVITKFEDPGFWNASIPLDHGIISHRRFEGSPSDKQEIAAEDNIGIEEGDDYVLGVKVEYFNRVNTSISIEPVQPFAIPGITKTISVWVVGRNFNHELKVVVEDFFGNTATIPLGTLNFSGWRQLTAAVPPTVVQRDPHYNNRAGIKILGFVIEPELTETLGSYYVYFDYLTVVTDLFAEVSRDPDDMNDDW